MTSGSGDGGTGRLILKLEEALIGKKYYEAHQLMRTINFRYQSCNKILELEATLVKVANLLLEADQYESGTDVGNMLASLYLEKKIIADGTRISILSRLVKKMRSSPDRMKFIGNAITWLADAENASLSGQFNYTVAGIYLEENTYQEAWKHILRIQDSNAIVEMTLRIISKAGVLKEEQDLVLAILILSFLAENRLAEAEALFVGLTAHMTSVTPLVNALRFTIDACKSHHTAAYLSLKQIYWPSLNRDPKVLRLFLSLGNIVFKIPKNEKGNGLMDNLLAAFSQSESRESSNLETMTLD